jgi:MFS family permease
MGDTQQQNSPKDQPLQLDGNEDSTRQESTLPPTDGGKDAWLMLVGCFIMEGLIWAFPYSFRIFQVYYSQNDSLKGDRSRIDLIGTFALGIIFLSSPVNLLILRRWPQHRRKYLVSGLLVSSISLTVASFARSIWQLIITQGILYGVGISMMYYPTMAFLDGWFVRRKGLAYGTAWAGSSFLGALVPLFVSWSLEKYGFRVTLRVWALAAVIIGISLMPFVKPRIHTTSATVPLKINLEFATSKPFLQLQVGNILEGLGFCLPGIFLPSYARSLGLNATVATISVVLVNTGSFFGCLMVGFLIDIWHVTNVIMLCTFGATVSVTFLWGFSNSDASFCIFALLYGFFAGSFSSTWAGIMLETVRQNPTAEPGPIYAMLVAGRGIGCVLSGPLSAGFLKAPLLTHNFTFGYGSTYGWLIFFTGMTNLLGGTGFVIHRLGWL